MTAETAQASLTDIEHTTSVIYDANRHIPGFMMNPRHRGPFVRINPRLAPATPVEVVPFEYANQRGWSGGEFFEPAYEGRRFLVNTDTETVYTKTGARLMRVSGTYAELLHTACVEVHSTEPHWLEVILPCLRVATGGVMKKGGTEHLGALVVLDVMQTATYLNRRFWLQERFSPLGVRQKPVRGEVYLSPTYTRAVAGRLAAGLALQNKEWGGRVYSGLVMKSANYFYMQQLRDAYETTYAREFFPLHNLDGFYYEV